ncbi:MAG: PAS domain S-box protein [Candidatus Cloacimonetes bacterium]|jgi:PAS domain S-box-containing protein|nr:PAS domain S-box protein [Candidatus Cloacimonadota bacterium]
MSKKQILVVEDEAVVAEDIRKILQSYGYQVPEAISTGEAAIKSINKTRPDLIILDIMLKDEISGIDVAEHIIDMDIPVIYLTAYSDKDIVEKAKATGPFGYLIKPFRERELVATIQMAFFKHQMEYELKESEAKFRALVETTDEGICMFDIENNFTFINEAGAKIFGSMIIDFEEANLSDYLNKNNLRKVQRHNKLRKENKSSRYELEIIRKDGRKRFLNIIGSPRFKNNKFIGTFGIFNDITEKKIAQLKLKRTMDSYTRIFENIQDVYYETEFDGTILEISPSIEQDSSYTRKELIGRSMYDLYFDEDQHDLFLTKLTKDGSVYDYEIILEDKDKTQLTCTINAKIIKDEDSGKVRIIGSLKNITEQRESETARQEYEMRYRKLFESSTDAVILQDKNGLIDCNNAALKLFGYTKKTELLHLNTADVSPPMQADKNPSRKSAETSINQTLKNGNMEFEWIYKKKNGKSFPAEVWLSSFKFNGKSFIQATIREIANITK